VIKKNNRIDLTVSFADEPATQTARTQYLEFYLARYAINGTFEGFEKLKTELSICPMTYSEIRNTLKFGAITKNTCEFNLYDLVKWNPDNLPQESNHFFDLFIKDSKGNLIDVPTLITNFRDADGKTPNSVHTSF
jgi:hypothetical protein